ncbi:MAG: AAA family ATPase [Bacteroidetes bacterium]|nr:AAA family ATPase [Bacteroidota bacterium]
MQIKKITLTNFRAYEYAEFNFKEGMNLLVGVNGAGKSSVLDVLNVCLSVIFSNISEAKVKRLSFSNDDISLGATRLQVSCNFTYLSVNYNLLIEKNKERRILTIKPEEEEGLKKKRRTKAKVENIFIDDQVVFTPQFKLRSKKLSQLGNESIAVLFSTKRSLITREIPSKTAIAGGLAAAYSEAFSADRFFNLRIFSDWYKVQKVLSKEKSKTKKHVSTLDRAIELFLPGFNNLRVHSDRRQTEFYIDKNNKNFKLRQLSDGERGMIALVFDIARRISQANPTSSDPLSEGNGIVLIDELDLHLHPKWQRTIVENLSNTFPKIQFIATTHSPQIIPSIEPEGIQLIESGAVVIPDRSLGMDSNWILRNLLDSEDRPVKSLKAIKSVEELINTGELIKAKLAIKNFKEKGSLDLAEWATLEARISKLEILKGEK